MWSKLSYILHIYYIYIDEKDNPIFSEPGNRCFSQPRKYSWGALEKIIGWNNVLDNNSHR